MSTEINRANWSFTYEKGLVDILKELNNIPMCKGQNGWSAQGWRNITKKFNEKFPLARFTKQQVQEKEKDLKTSYKILKEARSCSGAGWNESLGMLIAEPQIWEKMLAKNKNVKKFNKKSFPLYNDMALLHEGSVPTGDLNFTSTEVSNVAHASTSHTLERSNSEHSALNMVAGSCSENGLNVIFRILSILVID